MSPAASPFKFLDAYQQADADVFFGREEETRNLYNALSGVKHLLVYGPSGSGKTSLIECGLRNQFSDADWYALTIRRGTDINISVYTFINEALKEKIPVDAVTRLPADPQMDFGQAVERLFAERYQPVYLLFDQFEELLISGSEEEKIKFFTGLNKLIRNKLPCRILLIMREEFIGHLSEFEQYCPSIFQHRFRVEKMGRKNVEEVIRHILDAPHYRQFFTVEDSPKLAAAVLSKLPDNKKEIELTHVQVFLSELWDRALETTRTNTLPQLRTALIKENDNLEGVLESFLKKQMAELEKDYGEKVPLELLAAMITERFTKLQLSRAELEKDLQQKNVQLNSPLAGLLNELEKRRIIRSLKVDEETRYEISHDVLALVVGQNRTEEMKLREQAEDIYKVFMDKRGAYSQDDLDYLRPFQQNLAYPPELQQRIDKSIIELKVQQEEELTKARKRVRVLRVLLGVAFLAGIVAVYALVASNKAKKDAQDKKAIAETEKLRGDSILNRYFIARAAKENIEFRNLEARANIVLEANGCPEEIVHEMDSLSSVHKFSVDADSLQWKSIINSIKAKSPNCNYEKASYIP